MLLINLFFFKKKQNAKSTISQEEDLRRKNSFQKVKDSLPQVVFSRDGDHICTFIVKPKFDKDDVAAVA